MSLPLHLVHVGSPLPPLASLTRACAHQATWRQARPPWSPGGIAKNPKKGAYAVTSSLHTGAISIATLTSISTNRYSCNDARGAVTVNGTTWLACSSPGLGFTDIGGLAQLEEDGCAIDAGGGAWLATDGGALLASDWENLRQQILAIGSGLDLRLGLSISPDGSTNSQLYNVNFNWSENPTLHPFDITALAGSGSGMVAVIRDSPTVATFHNNAYGTPYPSVRLQVWTR